MSSCVFSGVLGAVTGVVCAQVRGVVGELSWGGRFDVFADAMLSSLLLNTAAAASSHVGTTVFVFVGGDSVST